MLAPGPKTLRIKQTYFEKGNPQDLILRVGR